MCMQALVSDLPSLAGNRVTGLISAPHNGSKSSHCELDLSHAFILHVCVNLTSRK